jgi:hypothetical protein
MVFRNVIINIALIIFSGIIYLFYGKYFTNYYQETWPSIFLGVIIMFIMFFCNIMGFYVSIITIRKTFITFIIYGVFIISTFLVYKSVSIIVKILEDNKIISECSSILFIGIIIIIENILSYIIVKKIIVRIIK